MGAEPWMYFVPYQTDINKALQELRAREFTAGRYFPAMMGLFLHIPIEPGSPSPGAQHASIEEAMAAADATGTQSILDMFSVSKEPQYFAVSPMDEEALDAVFRTTQPTHEMAAGNFELFDDIERGHGVYAVIYKDGKPDEILFAGYSFD
jgi:hypothetical protein